jgi:hypothetical protein
MDGNEALVEGQLFGEPLQSFKIVLWELVNTEALYRQLRGPFYQGQNCR